MRPGSLRRGTRERRARHEALCARHDTGCRQARRTVAPMEHCELVGCDSYCTRDSQKQTLPSPLWERRKCGASPSVVCSRSPASTDGATARDLAHAQAIWRMMRCASSCMISARYCSWCSRGPTVMDTDDHFRRSKCVEERLLSCLHRRLRRDEWPAHCRPP